MTSITNVRRRNFSHRRYALKALSIRGYLPSKRTSRQNQLCDMPTLQLDGTVTAHADDAAKTAEGQDTTRRQPSGGLVLRSQFWTAPNQLTLLRLIFIPFVIICVFDGNWSWALALIVAAGMSDGLDGLLARTLDQRTVLGQYLDPIADKMLLSSLFLVLSFVKKIPWKYTVLVFSRDALIVAICMVLYAAVGLRDFRPSIFGKINTVCQIAAVFFVILAQVSRAHWVVIAERAFLYLTFTFTLISGVHYILTTGQRLRRADPRNSP